jgi:hypothetical protein
MLQARMANVRVDGNHIALYSLRACSSEVVLTSGNANRRTVAGEKLIESLVTVTIEQRLGFDSVVVPASDHLRRLQLGDFEIVQV